MDSQHNPSTPLPAPEYGGPGSAALSEALQALYGKRRPLHYENPHPLSLGGDDPLDGISVFWRFEPAPHWHYVTFGFSDLFAKESATSAVSGFGFELTLRVAAGRGEETPPTWPLFLLQSLGRYVFRSRHGFHAGHRISTEGPISLGGASHLTALAFVPDPELPAIETAFGHVAFLQVVGLTRDEEQAALRWDTCKLLDAMRAHLPLWITHLGRQSMLAKPDVKAALDAGLHTDGSSTEVIFADALDIKGTSRFLRQPSVNIVLGARLIEQLVELLPLRLPFKRPLTIAGPYWKLDFETGRRNRITLGAARLHICVNEHSVQELATLLHPRRGVYRLPSFQRILWDVQQTWIRNAQGELTGVIG